MEEVITIETELFRDGAELPNYSTKGETNDTGADVCAVLENDVVIGPGERKLIPTGLKVNLPEGWGLQVRPRSGLALKYGITVLNTPGTIDNKYKDEIGVVLINTSKQDYIVHNKDRIAQLVVEPVYKAEFIKVDSIDTDNNRGGGFGHTGI